MCRVSVGGAPDGQSRRILTIQDPLRWATLKQVMDCAPCAAAKAAMLLFARASLVLKQSAEALHRRSRLAITAVKCRDFQPHEPTPAL